jgi:hypothetical protein
MQEWQSPIAANLKPLGQHAGITGEEMQTPTEGVGQHPGIVGEHKQERWVNMQEWQSPIAANLKPLGQHAGITGEEMQTPTEGVGQHPGIVGEHKQERWVNMRRNLQIGLVIVHRTVGVKELAGLPNTDLTFLVRIGDQLSLYSRP